MTLLNDRIWSVEIASVVYPHSGLDDSEPSTLYRAPGTRFDPGMSVRDHNVHQFDVCVTNVNGGSSGHSRGEHDAETLHRDLRPLNVARFRGSLRADLKLTPDEDIRAIRELERDHFVTVAGGTKRSFITPARCLDDFDSFAAGLAYVPVERHGALTLDYLRADQFRVRQVFSRD